MDYMAHFGEGSDAYKQFRPTYPDELYEFIYQHVRHFELAWDCATGNGQAAQTLAKRFKHIIASDLNAAQLQAAPQISNIEYQCWPAEKTNISDDTVDLITIAQALHWFDLPKFYEEVKRVAKPRAMIAAWCYDLPKLSAEIDALVQQLYGKMLASYWPKERGYIDAHYETIYFPFEKIAAPQFTFSKSMNLTHFLGYLNTWSAVKEYMKVNATNPIDTIKPALTHLWPKEFNVNWPIYMLIGEV